MEKTQNPKGAIVLDKPAADSKVFPAMKWPDSGVKNAALPKTKLLDSKSKISSESHHPICDKRMVKEKQKIESYEEVKDQGDVQTSKHSERHVHKNKKGILIGIKRKRNLLEDPINEITLGYDNKGQVNFKRVVTESDQVLSNLDSLNITKVDVKKSNVSAYHF